MISLGLRELRLTVSWWDLPALSKLKQIGVKFSPHTTQKQGTVKVLDPQGLLDAIRPLLVERAGEVADSLHLVERSKKTVGKKRGRRSERYEERYWGSRRVRAEPERGDA